MSERAKKWCVCVRVRECEREREKGGGELELGGGKDIAKTKTRQGDGKDTAGKPNRLGENEELQRFSKCISTCLDPDEVFNVVCSLEVPLTFNHKQQPSCTSITFKHSLPSVLNYLYPLVLISIFHSLPFPL